MQPARRARLEFRSPIDFGQARLAAIGWLLGLAEAEGEVKEEVLLARFRDARGRSHQARWDWLFLQECRGDRAATRSAARALAEDREIDGALLYLLAFADQETDTDFLITCWKKVRGDWQGRRLIAAGLEGLRTLREVLSQRGRKAEADVIFKESVSLAVTPAVLQEGLRRAYLQDDVKAFLAYFDRMTLLNNVDSYDPTHLVDSLLQDRASAGAWDDVESLLEGSLASSRRATETAALRSTATSAFAARGSSVLDAVDAFPRPGPFYGADALRILGHASKLFGSRKGPTFLRDRCRTRLEGTTGADRAFLAMRLAILDWTSSNRDRALAELGEAVRAAPDEAWLRLELAGMHAALGKTREALALVDSVATTDLAVAARRDWLSLALGQKLNDRTRAAQAAGRLAGTRLGSVDAPAFADKLAELGMIDQSIEVLSRVQVATAQRAMVGSGLLERLVKRNRVDLAVGIAEQILIDFPPAVRIKRTDLNPRAPAIDLFIRLGKLPELIERAESEVSASPHDVALYMALSEFYQAAQDAPRLRDTLMRLAREKPGESEFGAELISVFEDFARQSVGKGAWSEPEAKRSALALWDELFPQGPDDPPSRLRLFEVLVSVARADQDTVRAALEFERAERLAAQILLTESPAEDDPRASSPRSRMIEFLGSRTKLSDLIHRTIEEDLASTAGRRRAHVVELCRAADDDQSLASYYERLSRAVPDHQFRIELIWTFTEFEESLRDRGKRRPLEADLTILGIWDKLFPAGPEATGHCAILLSLLVRLGEELQATRDNQGAEAYYERAESLAERLVRDVLIGGKSSALDTELRELIMRRGRRFGGSPRSFAPLVDSRETALQLLHRRGMLRELIRQAETEAVAATKKLPILLALVAYYQAAGESAGLRWTYERIGGAVPPDDASLVGYVVSYTKFEERLIESRTHTPLEAYSTAVALWDKVCPDPPQDPEALSVLLDLLIKYGDELTLAGQESTAKRYYERAARLAEQVLRKILVEAESAKVPRDRSADSREGFLRRDPSTDSSDESLRDLRRAPALRFLHRRGELRDLIRRIEAEARSAKDPVPSLQELVGYFKTEKDAPGLKRTYEWIAAARPGDERLLYQSAKAYTEFQELLVQQRKLVPRRGYEESLALWDRFFPEPPKAIEARADLLGLLTRLADDLKSAKDDGAAERQLARAEALAGRILRDSPPPAKLEEAAEGPRGRAVQILIRRNKLSGLIKEAEAGLKAAKDPLPLLRALAEYHWATEDTRRLSETFQQILKSRPDDTELRSGLTRVFVDFVGRIVKKEKDGERAAYEAALATWDKLLPRILDDFGDRLTLFSLLRKLGDVCSDKDRDTALGYYQRMETVMAASLKADPDSDANKQNYAIALESIGNIYLAQDKVADAAKLYQRQLDLDRAWLRSEPTSTKAMYNLSYSVSNIARLRAKQGDEAGAKASRGEQLRLTKAALEKEPLDKDYIRAFTEAHEAVGKRVEKPDEARAAWLELIEWYKAKLKADSKDEKVSKGLADAYEWLGDIELRLGNASAAYSHEKRCLEIRMARIDATPDQHDARRQISFAYLWLAHTAFQAGYPEEARRNYDSYLMVYRDPQLYEPGEAQSKDLLADALVNVAGARLKTGDAVGSLTAAREALSLREAKWKSSPKDVDGRRKLAAAHATMSNVFRDMGELDTARAEAKKSLDLSEELLKEKPGEAQSQIAVADDHARLGRIASDRGDFAEAQEKLRKAIGILAKREAEKKLTGADHKEELKSDRLALAVCERAGQAIRDLAFAQAQNPRETAVALLIFCTEFQVRSGDAAQAMGTAEALRALAPNDAENLFDTARCYAAIARAVARGRTRDHLPVAEQAVRDTSARKAIAALAAAATAGFGDGPRLLSDSALNAIRSEPEYREFIEQFVNKGKVPAKL